MFESVPGSSTRQCIMLGVVAALCAIPFGNKAFHMDADMLVYTTQQFLVDPINPPLGEYGKRMVLHDHTKMPQSSIFYRTGHPPLLPVVLMPVVAWFGISEWPIHAVLFLFYLMSIFTVWGLLGLAYSGGIRFFGALLWTISPVLLINSHNIMWDVPITGMMLLSFYLFLRALRSERPTVMVLSGVVAGLAALMKVNALPLFIICPGYLLMIRRFRLLFCWLSPAVALPMLWVVHNIIVYNKIHFISIGWYSFLSGDIRYRMERNLSYFGGALILPVFLAWLLIARGRFRELLWTTAACGIWGAALVAILGKNVGEALCYALFAGCGLWLIIAMAGFFRGPKAGAFKPWEPGIISAFAGLYFIVLNIMPSASMRYILPLMPFALFVIVEAVSGLSGIHKRLFFPLTISVTLLVSLSLAIGDYLVCEADRRLPAQLIEKGYGPSQTWYYGRLSYEWYLYHQGYRNLRADTGRPESGDFLVDEKIPGDYSAEEILGSGYRIVPIDTMEFFRWPIRTLGSKAGFYGDDRLPWSIAFGTPQKRYIVYRIDRLQPAPH